MTKKRILKDSSFNRAGVHRTPKINTGRWSFEEHYNFINGVFEHGNSWEDVQLLIKSRNVKQLLSHSQKFFLKLKNSNFFGTENMYSAKNLKQVMQLKSEKEREKLKSQLMKFNYGDIFNIEEKIHRYDFDKVTGKSPILNTDKYEDLVFNGKKNEPEGLLENSNSDNILIRGKFEYANGYSNFNYHQTKNIFLDKYEEPKENANCQAYPNTDNFGIFSCSSAEAAQANSTENLQVNINNENNYEIKKYNSNQNKNNIFDLKIKSLSGTGMEILKEIEAQFCGGIMNENKNKSTTNHIGEDLNTQVDLTNKGSRQNSLEEIDFNLNENYKIKNNENFNKECLISQMCIENPSPLAKQATEDIVIPDKKISIKNENLLHFMFGEIIALQRTVFNLKEIFKEYFEQIKNMD